MCPPLLGGLPSLVAMSAAGPAEGSLARILGEIWASPLPRAERRRIAASVAASCAHGHGLGWRAAAAEAPSSAPACGSITAMEEALLAVGQLAGGPGASALRITEAKSVLRGIGDLGCKLASRLGRLSKARNASAHPDVGLVKDILLLKAEVYTEKEVDSDGEQVANGHDDSQRVFGKSEVLPRLLGRQCSSALPAERVANGTTMKVEGKNTTCLSLAERAVDVLDPLQTFIKQAIKEGDSQETNTALGAAAALGEALMALVPSGCAAVRRLAHLADPDDQDDDGIDIE